MQRWDWVVASIVGILLIVATLPLNGRAVSQDAWLVDFYPSEGGNGLRYSFSRPASQAFLPDVWRGGAALVLRVRSPEPLSARTLALDLNGQAAASAEIGAQPRTLRILLPTGERIRTAGFLLGLRADAAQAPGDARTLGMLFEYVGVVPLEAGASPVPALLVAAAAVFAGARLALRRWPIVIAWPTAALALLCASWAAAFSFYAVANHRLYRSNTYDLGHFDQALWLLSRGYTPYSTGMGINVLGDHASLLLYPLALLYVVLPDVRALLVVQCVFVALGTVPLFLLARGRGHPLIGLMLAAAYLLHPATQNLALFDFHPDALAGAALLWAAWAFERRRWLVLYACCAAVLFAKENFALTVAFFGLWITAMDWAIKPSSAFPSAGSGQAVRVRPRPKTSLPATQAAPPAGSRSKEPSSAFVRVRPRPKNPPHGLIIAALSVVWFVVATRWLLPSLNGHGQSLHLLERYGQYGDSPLAIALTLLRNPLLLASALFSAASLVYLWQLAVPFGLLCVLGPRYALLALPALLLNLLSASPDQRTVLFQYNALIVPAFALAALEGAMLLRSLAGRRFNRGRSALQAAGLILLVEVAYSLAALPLRLPETQAALANPSDRLRYYDYALSLVPPEASASAQAMMQPHLAERRQAYLFPNPFRQVVFFNPAQMPYTASADYVLYDTKRPDDFFAPSGEKLALLHSLRASGAYQTVLDLDGVLLLRRINNASAGAPTTMLSPHERK